MGRIIPHIWDEKLIQKYDMSGPRYTSYPTALQLDDNIGVTQWLDAVESSNAEAKPLSLYIHIPFCDTVCFYCGCHKIITANKKAAEPYIESLLKEISLQAELIPRERRVKQIHWGGGTPTFLSDDEISKIMQSIGQNFSLSDDHNGEYGIEIHPNSVDIQRIHRLREMGFNRLSLGVQDFDPAVQNAVNRFNSVVEVQGLMDAAHRAEFQSINLDLIYGLPKQSCESFTNTLKHVIDLDPHRISLFNYAHMPHLFKTQRQIDDRDLPEPQEKLRILNRSIELLLNAGYVYIGMDHFAKPDDELAIAQRDGALHRNFQGYSTHNNCDLFAFGVSSISMIGDALFQNTKSVADYSDKLEAQTLPLARGVKLSEDDKIRKMVISAIMCNFKCEFKAVEHAFGIRFDEYFETEISRLLMLAGDGLISIDETSISVRPKGRLLVRRICMEFDSYIDRTRINDSQKYSRII